MKIRLFVSFGVALLSAIAPLTAHADCSIGRELELPVTMQGLRPVVTVQINGRDARFVADSGAFFSSISPGSAAEYGLRLEPAPPGFSWRGIGGSVNPSIATVKELSLSGVKLQNMQFLVGGSEVGGQVGLLGQNVLGIADVEYDLAHGAIRLMKTKGCARDANLAYWSTGKNVSELEIESKADAHSHTRGTVILNGAKIRAVFDTGSPTTILTTSAAARAGIKPDSPGVQPAGYSSGLGRQTIRTWTGPFQSLKIGDNEEIQKIRLRFGDIGDDFDMLIGADFFLSHRVYVANGVQKMFFTYNGGPVFDLTNRSAPPIADTPKPVMAGAGGSPASADDYARLGEALASRQQFDQALADLDKAVALAPADSRYVYQRALIHGALHQPLKAQADLDTALKLDPANRDALLRRTEIRLVRGERVGAREDADALDKALAPSADVRLQLAAIYQRLDDADRAIAQYDLWIAAHPADHRLPEAYNGRCWMRALAGRELDKALPDCDRALHLAPHTASFLDSRGLARLRSGDFAKAIGDYDEALKINPNLAWSLYGRGLAKRHQGDRAGGDADIAAALKLQPGLAGEAKRRGIDPGDS